MRLIDAETLWKAITTRIEECCDLAELSEIIETQPTVDAVPVIRCKDCKWWVDKTSYRSYPICADYERSMNADDFCSRAERKEK